MAPPRDIDMELVDAYLARRALDYLVGFTLSPVLWRKLPGAKSAGRVQSVALRLVGRPRDRDRGLPPAGVLDRRAQVSAGGEPFLARLVTLDRKRLGKFDLPDEASAQRAKKAVLAGDFSVHAIETKPARRSPPPPFTTSTLQQEASRKLGFNATRTMQAAQRLYEASTSAARRWA
jgi:DNA topoisomerase-1